MFRRVTKIGLFVSLTAVGLFLSNLLYDRVNDGFNHQNITPSFDFSEQVNFPPLTSSEIVRINEILNQRFFFIGKGAQIYAFAGEDGVHVLKIVKQKNYRFYWLEGMLLQLPFLSEKREARLLKKEKKYLSFLNSCALCYEELKEETALLYAHLTKTVNLHPKVVIYDKLGVTHEIDLNETEFLLQYKADSMADRVASLVKRQDLKGARNEINKLKQLLQDCMQKGMMDRDKNILNNIGFIGEKAIFIDFGQLFKGDDSQCQFFLQRHFQAIDKWVTTHYPQLDEV